MSESYSPRLGIIGLGYVGLPLAVAFGRHYPTTGYDISSHRVAELRQGRDRSLEVDAAELAEATLLELYDDERYLVGCDFLIVTVPTPINDHKQPDLRSLESASATVGRVIGPGTVVIYESTVYPGCTEEICIPIIEKLSGLSFNRDFFAGYSPERINPGDRAHRLATIRKVTAGSTPETAERVDALYRRIVTAGTHKASSIRVAEAAKVIENTQRDLNIALINELSLIFNRLGIDTGEVLEAAGTKWNFLPFRPGLVGGHCIGVDPYYLTHKAQAIGYHPEVILAGRRLNDRMGAYVASQVIKLMMHRQRHCQNARVLILGLTFKENCPDLRNTRVVDILAELKEYGFTVDVHDPWAHPDEARHEYGIELVSEPAATAYDAIVIAVAHRQFRELGVTGLRRLGKPGAILYDVKHLLPKDQTDGRL